MPHIATINNKNYTLELSENKHNEIINLISLFMGDDFSKYVYEYISELEEKSNEEYWKAHTDEQAYEEELNEIHGMLNEVWEYLNKIKLTGTRYKKTPEWEKMAIETMKLMEEYM